MSSEQYEALLEALSEGDARGLSSIIGFIIITGLFAIIAVFSIAYFKQRGTNLATKKDLDQILEQTRDTTEIIEYVRMQVARAKTVGTADLEYRKQQLAEFYGPIYARLKVSAMLYDLWMEGKLHGINDEILQLFYSQNNAIREIITTKTHLVEGNKIPPVFAQYMTSTLIFNFYTPKTEGNMVPDEVKELPESMWPKEFVTYIFKTTEQLKEKLDRLYRQHRIKGSETAVE